MTSRHTQETSTRARNHPDRRGGTAHGRVHGSGQRPAAAMSGRGRPGPAASRTLAEGEATSEDADLPVRG